MAFLDPEKSQPFDEALTEFLADWHGLEDTDDIISALRDKAEELERSRADDV